MLVSLADMKSYLGITDTTYDTFLTEQLNVISSAIENYCGRIFEVDTYTQTIYKDDYTHQSVEELFLYHFPVNSITSITDKTNNQVLTEYRFEKSTGKIILTDENGDRIKWFEDYQKLEVVYSAGYSTIPYTIQAAVKALVEERYNKKKTGISINFGNDVQRMSIPGVMSIDFDYTLQANERKNAFGMFLGNYLNVIDYYRSERVLVGDCRSKYVE